MARIKEGLLVGGGWLPGLGPGHEGLQGFLLHSVLAMRWWGVTEEEAAPKTAAKRRPPVEVLGLAAQSYRIRSKEAPGGRRTPQPESAEREKARIV